MAERKLDLARIALTKFAPEAGGGKGDTSLVIDEEKALTGSLEDSKDQLTSESSLPLSPQWLYSKNSDGKVGNSASFGDTRLQSSLSHGISADSMSKDSWRQDGTPDKKDWRKNAPDADNSRRWRDEEREVGSLGRRDRKKEGDREGDHRKNDRRPENVAGRDSGEPRNMPSDRWHETTGRNTGVERRDSKWSSRWGPEEKDSRSEKKIDTEKEDQFTEKKNEPDSRDKWRPRHRLEAHSSSSAVYRAAPGFGSEGGRVEASPHTGFALGRGRGSIVGCLPQCRPYSTGPIGAAPIIDAEQGKNGLFAEMFRYPRGKLLDIYRKQRTLPDFEIVPDGFDNAPVAQSKSTPPFAFITPDSTEKDLLEDISKGKITGSQASFGVSKGQKTRSENYGFPAVSGVISDTVFSGTKIDGEDYKVLGHPEQEEKNYKDAECLEYSSNSVRDEGTLPAPPYDASIKLPDDSSFLFETSFMEEIPREVSNIEMASFEDLSLLYQDPQGDIQGPFLGADIISWFEQGFFGIDLPICLSDAPEGTPFRTLGDIMPLLKVRDKSTHEVNSCELSVPLDIANDKLEAIGSHASSFSASLDVNDPRLTESVSEPIPGHEFQSRMLDLRCYIGSPTGRTLVSEIPDSEIHALHDFSGQDAEEVLYTGRRMNDIENFLDRTGNEESAFSRASFGRQREIAQPHVVAHNNSIDREINPLGLLWSELESSHVRHPISSSSTIADVDDRIHNFNPSALDSLMYAHQQDQFNAPASNPYAHDAWPGSSIQNSRSNKIQDGMDAGRSSHFEAELNRLALQDQLLSQQFQKQHLQKHLSSAHQNMHIADSFALQKHLSGNQSMLDFEHLFKLQLQEQHHIQRLHEQQQQQKQQQLLQQIHLLKQHQQQQQEQQQQQLLFEHLLQRQAHDPGFGSSSHADSLLRNSSLEHILLRQHLLRELENQPHHLQRNQDVILEQLLQAKLGHNLHHDHQNDLLDVLSHQKQHRHSLSAEDQFLLSLQQEQQARQFPHASRQKRVMEEDRHVGGIWPADESSQFHRTMASSHQPHLNRFTQPDFIQSLQQHSPFDQASLLDQVRMQQQNPYERNAHPFDSSIIMSRGPSEPNTDVLNAIARLQGLDMAEAHGQMHPSVQGRQFHHSNSSHDHHISNQFRPRLDAIDSQWAESGGQLPNNLTDAQLSQLHFEAQRQRRDARGSLVNIESNTWAAIGGNENVNHGMDQFFQQQMLLRPTQSLEFIDTTTADHDSGWYTRPSFDNSYKPGAETAGQDGMMNANMENEISDFDINGKFTLRSRSNLPVEQNQFFPEVNEIEKEQTAGPLIHDSSVSRADFSDFKDVKRLKKRSAKGKAALSISDQAASTLSDHSEAKISAPTRHTLLGSSAGSLNFQNYDTCTDTTYGEGIPISRSLRILERGSGSGFALKHSQGPLPSPSQGAMAEYVSSQAEGKTPSGLLSSETSVPGVLKDLRFRRTSSSSDADAPEASFIDAIKSSKKPTELDATNPSAHDYLEGGYGGKGLKKKGKKGRQIDPSLLGFKIHSNRIMMGEIQRPDD